MEIISVGEAKTPQASNALFAAVPAATWLNQG